MDLKAAKEILGEEFNRDADFIEKIISYLELNKNSKILDIGTGRGVMVISLALKGYKVITGEPEEDKWADWNTSAKKVGVDHLISFKPFKAEILPFENSSFDAIFLFSTLHHIIDKERALKECLRVLKSKGILVIIELTPESVEKVRKKRGAHPDVIDPREYTKELPLKVKVFESLFINGFIFERK